MASIAKRGTAWRARVRRAGEPLLTKTFDTRAEAEAWATREEGRIAAGDPVPPGGKPTTDMTVAELFAKYATEVSPDKGGWRWEVIRLRKLAGYFEGVQASSVDAKTIARWRDRRLSEVSADSVIRELALLGSVWTRAMREWDLPGAVNPVRMVSRPRRGRARTRRVSDAERATVLRFLAWDGTSAPRDTRQWIAWGFCVAIETAMRQGELLRVTWDHVHLDRRCVHLPKTKNGDTRDVPLTRAAVAMFEMLTPGDAGQRVLPVNAGTFGCYFREAVADAEIPDMHFHDTRREGATRAAAKLSNVLELSAFTGHRDLRSLKVYYAPNVSDIARKLD